MYSKDCMVDHQKVGDGCHPSPKMTTAENPTSGKPAFDHVAGHGSFLGDFFYANRY